MNKSLKEIGYMSKREFIDFLESIEFAGVKYGELCLINSVIIDVSDDTYKTIDSNIKIFTNCKGE